MKILYVTNHISIANASGGFINDYLNDLIFYGLYELCQNGIIDEIVDSTQIISLYSEFKSKISPRNLWGGMTSFWLISDNKINRKDIIEKISNKYFDIIIYGSVYRCLDYYDIVSKVYDDKNVILLDGNDDGNIHPLSDKHLYFKRELYTDKKNVVPISFSYPTCKVTLETSEKIQDYGTVIPDDRSTYIFKNETDYYNDYNKSYFGVTKKKAGWDCLRHYEILGNRCIPYFLELEKCPKNILTHLSKELLLEARELTNDFDVEKYHVIQRELFEHTKKYLTTKSMAKYIMDEINNRI